MFDPRRGYPSAVVYLRYADPIKAIHWLTDVVQAREAVRMTLPDGRVGHAELTIGNTVVSLGLAAEPAAPGEPVTRQSLRAMTLVFVDDVDRAMQRALRAGGTLIDAATDQPWGLRQGIVADPGGHFWELSTHQRDVELADWGATSIAPLPG